MSSSKFKEFSTYEKLSLKLAIADIQREFRKLLEDEEEEIPIEELQDWLEEEVKMSGAPLRVTLVAEPSGYSVTFSIEK